MTLGKATLLESVGLAQSTVGGISTTKLLCFRLQSTPLRAEDQVGADQEAVRLLRCTEWREKEISVKQKDN